MCISYEQFLVEEHVELEQRKIHNRNERRQSRFMLHFLIPSTYIFAQEETSSIKSRNNRTVGDILFKMSLIFFQIQHFHFSFLKKSRDQFSEVHKLTNSHLTKRNVTFGIFFA